MAFTFNDLSLLHKIDSRERLKTILENFVRCFQRADVIGIRDLRISKSIDFYSAIVGAEYSVHNWLQDATVDTDLRTRFRDIIGTYPLINDGDFYYDNFSWSNFSVNVPEIKHTADALGAAYLSDGISVSLGTHTQWTNVFLYLTHEYVDNNGTLHKNDDAEVRNFFDLNSLARHEPWWRLVQEDFLTKSAELWEKRQQFFNRLVFCKEVQSQLQRIGISKTLHQIIDRLHALNAYVANWHEGNFQYQEVNKNTNLRISPESDATIAKYGSRRRFTVPEAGKKIFDLHIKTGELRMHFWPDNEKRIIYIGYIGKHLPIVSEG